MKEKSKRHKIADSVSDLVVKSGYNNPYGGAVRLLELDGRKYYGVSFCFRRLLSGKVSVYGEEFILLEYKYSNKNETKIFNNIDDFNKYFKLGLIQSKWSEAKKVNFRKIESDSKKT